MRVSVGLEVAASSIASSECVVAISRSVQVSNNRLKQAFQPRKRILVLFGAGEKGRDGEDAPTWPQGFYTTATLRVE